MTSYEILSQIRNSVAVILLLILLMPELTTAQMFSLGSESQRRATIPEYSLYFGFEPAIVSYYGDIPAGPENSLYNFRGTLLRGRYETGSLQIYGAMGSGLSDDEDIMFRNIGIQLQGNLPVYMKPAIAWSIPLVASTDYVLMRTSDTANTTGEFSQNRLLFGLGQELIVRPAERFRVRLKSVARYGVSASSFGSSVGTAFVFDQQARVYFDRLFGPIGLSAGIDYSYNRFMTAEDAFKYNLDSFSFLIGITF